MLSLRLSLRTTTLLLIAASPLTAQMESSALRALEHEDYEIWNRIDAEALSNDGRWALFTLSSEANDGTLTVVSVTGETRHVVERAEDPTFSDDSRFVAFTIKPTKASVEEAEENDTPRSRMPPDTLGILDLETGAVSRVARIRSFRMPEEAAGWIAYQLGREPESGDSAADSPRAERPAGGDSTDADSEREREEGYSVVLRSLDSGEERRIEDVVTYEFTEDGARLVYTRSNEAGDADGVYVMDTQTGAITTLRAGKGEYKQVAVDEAGRQVAFLANDEEFSAEQPSWKLYYWDGDDEPAREAASPASTGITEGWWISDDGELRFSPNGERLFFGTAPRPEPEPEEDADDDEKVVVDIWNWKDPLLQPMQLARLEEERDRTYDAVLFVDNGDVVQLERPEIPSVNVALRGDGDFGIGESNLPYRQEISWGESGEDIYYIDLRTGEATQIIEYNQGNTSLSPGGRYVTWFDGEQRAWFAMDVRERNPVNISAQVPFPVHDELHDAPSLPRSYGSAGWTEDDELFLIYDRHDIWAVDPTGREAPRSITEGVGRRDSLQLRYVRLDPEEQAIDPSPYMLLSAFNVWTKAAGFYVDRVNGTEPPTQVLMGEKQFGRPIKAEDASTMLYTRSDFREFPDLWVADLNFANARKISDANPQQSQYRWGTAELVDWHSANGEVLQGVLYKPDGFDPSRQYPMMVYFYERLSDNLYDHIAPAPNRASINISFYVSRGYLVFTPDIPYRIGYPGESAFNAVVPGVLDLVSRGFVDEDRIGVQGHSWGGYQIAYLVTKTDIFRAAEAGAPVANMTSAYGGIRWQSGMSRMFQYEKTQSRLGGTLWEKPMRFIENSPLFWADKVNTPLLMMHNDEDGAVPWEQGIEYFVALRRLGKPAWLLNYNGEAHGLTQRHNQKDWTIRLQQFFDHYLMDAPAPVWLEYGVPATEKGRTLGLELITEPITDR